MVIDFNNMDEERLPEFKGGKGAYNAKRYSADEIKIMHGRLEPGSSIGLHSHETNSEVIYVLSGTAEFIYDDGTETVSAGECHYCPKGHSHSMMNNGDEDLIFFAVVPEQ